VPACHDSGRDSEESDDQVHFVVSGKQRAEIYRHGIGRVERALREGFWLEAITLQESLISDRLEYLLHHVTGRHKHTTLAELLTRVERDVPPDLIDVDLMTRVDDWRKQRNAALHMMMKFSLVQNTSWLERLGRCREAAWEGRAVMRQVDAWVRKTKRRI